jgi:hypothetical protein
LVTVLTNEIVLVTVDRGKTVHLYLVNVRTSVDVACTFWIAVGAGAVTVLMVVVVVSACSTIVLVVVEVLITVLTMVGVLEVGLKHVAVSISVLSWRAKTARAATAARPSWRGLLLPTFGGEMQLSVVVV